MWTVWYLHISMLCAGHKNVLFAVQNTIPTNNTFSLTVRDRPFRWRALLLPGVVFTGWSLIWVTCGAGRICITCFVGVVIAAWVWTAATTGVATRPADVWSVSDGCGLAGLCHTHNGNNKDITYLILSSLPLCLYHSSHTNIIKHWLYWTGDS